MPIARMRQPRLVLEQITPAECEQNDDPFNRPDAARCVPGAQASLFPATTFYVTADVVAHDAKVWHRTLRRYVRRDLKSKVFYQVGGRTPDFNKNGTDDAIDIRFGQSKDGNRDGVPDEAQRR